MPAGLQPVRAAIKGHFSTACKVDACMHACRAHACRVHAYRVHACEVHARTHTCIHACMHACRVHACMQELKRMRRNAKAIIMYKKQREGGRVREIDTEIDRDKETERQRERESERERQQTTRLLNLPAPVFVGSVYLLFSSLFLFFFFFLLFFFLIILINQHVSILRALIFVCFCLL